jgi:hypothetical protein
MSTRRRDVHLEPTSVLAVVIYSLVLASGLVAHSMGFPKFSTEPRATSLTATVAPAPPSASGDETIGYR